MMGLPDPQNLPLPALIAMFLAAAVVVWLAGARASYLADDISDRTVLGKAFAGYVLLAIATNAPEIGTTVTAALSGDAALATNNMFGGILFQTFILVIIDVAMIRGALTYFATKPALPMQGIILTLLLALLLVPVVSGYYLPIAGVSAFSFVLAAVYLYGAYLSQRYETEARWEPTPVPASEERLDAVSFEGVDVAKRYDQWTLRRVSLGFALAVGVIFVAGVVLARTGQGIAIKTGLGSSFVGATLVASSTSLPELSTTITAIRIGNLPMAIANIFGSNGGMLVTLLIADVFYRQGPIVAASDASAHFNVAMGIVLTGVYLIGLMQRSHRSVLRMGYDSLIVAILYVASLVVLYQLR